MYTIIQITDLHIDNNDPELELLSPEGNLKAFLKYADKIPCDEIIVTGDVAEAEESFLATINRLQGLCVNIKYVAGNHDPKNGFILLNPQKPYFMEYLEEFLVLYLDSSQGIIDENQLQWLNDHLTNNQKDILIFLHHPILNCGNTLMDKMYPLMNRSEVYSLLKNTRKKVYIFSGHYHWEQEVIYDNIKQYVTPSLLYQLDKDADLLRVGSVNFGFRVIKISEDNVESYVEVFDKQK